MFKSFVFFSIVTALSVNAQAATLTGDAANGKKLHDASCTSCHNDSVYKRKDHKIKSLDELTQQVRNCEHMTDITLGKSQENDLVKYLNETYYKLK